jgi:hypothetical protein
MIQPGQINYHKQLQDLSMVPPSAEGISYLQQLANNPSSPFVKFLVESRMEQITKALSNQQGEQAEPPQGTIKDRIEQSAGIAALQAAQQRQAPPGMPPQQGAPIPAGIPEPQMQGEPERERGIASSPVDEDMFNFAPGGIVAFAKGDKVTDEEKEKLRNATQMYIEAAQQRAAEDEAKQAAADRVGLQTVMDQYAQYGEGQQGIDNRGPMQAPSAPAAVPADSENLPLGQRITNNLARIRSRTDPTAPAVALPAPFAAVGDDAMAKSQKASLDKVMAALAPAAAAATPSTAIDDRTRRTPSLYGPKPVAPPPPPAPTTSKVPGGIAGPAPGALMGPPAPPTGLDAAMQKALAGPKDITTLPGYSDYKTAQDKLLGEIKPETKVEDDIAKRLELYKSLGIGKSDEVAEKLIKDRAARYEKTQKARDMNNFMDQLADYATPGANFSNVVKGEQARRAQQMSADEIFAQEQDKMTLEVIKNKEARTMGALGDVVKEAADKSKNRLEAIKAIATNASVPLQQATQLYDAYIRSVGTAWTTAQNVAAQDRSTAAHERVGMAQVAATREGNATRSEIARERIAVQNQALEARLQGVLGNNPEYKSAVEARNAAERMLNIPSLDEKRKAQFQAQVDSANERIATITNSILKGGLGSIAPATAPPGGKDKVLDFNKIGAAK